MSSRTNNHNPRGHTNKYPGSTGYTLHAQRIAYTRGSGAIRTVKYPIFGLTGKDTNELALAIENDYYALNGNININCYRDPPRHSLIDFWLDSLRVGGFFASSYRRLLILVEKLAGRDIESQIFSGVDANFLKKLNRAKVVEDVVFSSGFRKIDSLKRAQERVIRLFKESAKKDEMTIRLAEEFAKVCQERSPQEGRDFLIRRLGITIPEKIREVEKAQKLTFYISPTIEWDKKKVLPPQRLLKRVAKALEEDTGGADWAGLDTQANALSYFFNKTISMLRDRESDFTTLLLKESDLWKGQERELAERVEYLANSARKLEVPKLTDGWHGYRKYFSGRIKSWYSNYLTREEEIRKTLQSHRKPVEMLQHELENMGILTDEDNKECSESDLRCLRKSAIDIGRQINKILNEMLDPKREGFASDKLQLYSDLLHIYKLRLNTLFQQTNFLGSDKKEALKRLKGDSDDTEHINIRDIKKYNALLKKIKKEPLFFGEDKANKCEQFLNCGRQLAIAVKTLDEVEDLITKQTKQSPSQAYIRRQLDTLVKQYYNANSNLFKSKIRKMVLSCAKEFPPISRLTGEPTKVFSVNRYVRGRVEQLSLRKDVDPAKMLDMFIDQLRYGGDWRNLTTGQLIDWAEAVKIRWGWLLTRHKDASINTKTLNLESLPYAKTMRKLLGSEMRNQNLQMFINNALAGVLRKNINLLSKKEIIVRTQIQIVGADKRMPIVRTGQEWGVLLPKLTISGKGTDKSAMVEVFGDKKTKTPAMRSVRDQSVFRIRSSRFQTQFLNWWLREQAPEKKGGVTLARMEHALISERIYELNWDRYEQVSLKRKGKPRVFVSIPFKMIPPKGGHNRNTGDTRKKLQQRRRYLGVDVGEYGLAWSILDFGEGYPKLLRSGFIYEPRIREVRHNYASLKRRQIRGTFASTSTALARQRKQAVGSLRNKLHFLAIRYDAKIVFEKEIDNFETGSRRVSALYRSVKRSDTFSGNEAENTERAHIWGKLGKVAPLIGSETSAYATSQTCSNCGRSVLHEIAKDGHYKVKKVGKKKWGVVTPKGDLVRIFGKSLSSEGVVDGQLARKLAKDYIRPPIDAETLREIREKLPERVLKKFIKERGNSAIFVCPFCGHISDADIQASVHIGFKKRIWDTATKEERGDVKNWGTLFFDTVADSVKRGQYPKVGLLGRQWMVT